MITKSAWGEIADKDKSVWKKIEYKKKMKNIQNKESFEEDLNRLRKRMRRD